MKKGGALGAFFAKAKKAPAPSDDSYAAAPASSAPRSALDTPLYDGAASGWDNAPDPDDGPGGARAAASLVSEVARVHLKVAELGDDDAEENDEEMLKRIDGEEVHKALAAAKRHAAKAAKKAAAEAGGGSIGAGAAAAAAVEVEASTSVASLGGWRAKLEARKKGAVDADGFTTVGGGKERVSGDGVKDGRVLAGDTRVYPSLRPGAATAAAGPRPVAPGKALPAGVWASKKSTNAAAVDEDDSDEEEGGAGGEGGSAAPAEGGAEANEASSAAAAAKAVAKAAASEGLAVVGNNPIITTSAEVAKQTRFIAEELLVAQDSAGALLRLTELRCSPSSLREGVIEGLLTSGLEVTTKLSERLALGKLLSLLVPGRVVTREALNRCVGDLMSLYTDLVTDFPKADVQLSDLCGAGLVCGTLRPGAFASTGPGLPGHDAAAQAAKGYVPLGFIHPIVAAKMGRDVGDLSTAGTFLPKTDDGEDYGDEEGVGGAGEGAAAPAPAAAAAAEPVAAAPAPIVEEEEEETAVATKKKKKKKALVLGDRDDEE